MLLFIFNVEINNNTIILVIKSRSTQRINPGSNKSGVWTSLGLRKKNRGGIDPVKKPDWPVTQLTQGKTQVKNC
jgi:hypothetical protein